MIHRVYLDQPQASPKKSSSNWTIGFLPNWTILIVKFGAFCEFEEKSGWFCQAHVIQSNKYVSLKSFHKITNCALLKPNVHLWLTELFPFTFTIFLVVTVVVHHNCPTKCQRHLWHQPSQTFHQHQCQSGGFHRFIYLVEKFSRPGHKQPGGNFRRPTDIEAWISKNVRNCWDINIDLYICTNI